MDQEGDERKVKIFLETWKCKQLFIKRNAEVKNNHCCLLPNTGSTNSKHSYVSPTPKEKKYCQTLNKVSTTLISNLDKDATKRKVKAYDFN